MMKTEILKIESLQDTVAINRAGVFLREGKLVAFPTETVYGIGANALLEDAVTGIYKAKGRPSDNPLIVHIGEIKDVYLYALEVSKKAEHLMAEFWPGPLTLIFKKNEKIPLSITGGLDTVAIRCPKHDLARAIITASERPIAAPSANISGRPSPTMAAHVVEDLTGKVDMIIDGGDATIGLESTIVDMTQDIPIILRPGGITKAMLEAAIGEVTFDKHLLNTAAHVTPRAPGMKYTHYAPKGELTIYDGNDELVVKAINQQIVIDLASGYRCGVIAFVEDRDSYQCSVIEVIGAREDHEQIAANLFKILRNMDEQGIQRIYAKAVLEEEIGLATMNRLLKAAGNRKVIL